MQATRCASQPLELRVDVLAVGDDVYAPRREGAAMRRRPQHGRNSGDSRDAQVRFVGPRDAGQERLCVGVPRIGEQVGGRPFLYDAARVHDRHPVDHAGDDAEVMGDEHEGHVPFVGEALQQPEYLRLDRDVQRGRGLVGDEQGGVVRDRDRDHHPLPHPARQLEGVGADALPGRGNGDRGEQVDGGRVDCASRQARVVDLDGLADLPPDGEDGVQRGHGVLEDHADLGATDLPELAVAEPDQLDAVELDRSAEARVLRQQRGHREHAQALAGP